MCEAHYSVVSCWWLAEQATLLPHPGMGGGTPPIGLYQECPQETSNGVPSEFHLLIPVSPGLQLFKVYHIFRSYL